MGKNTVIVISFPASRQWTLFHPFTSLVTLIFELVILDVLTSISGFTFETKITLLRAEVFNKFVTGRITLAVTFTELRTFPLRAFEIKFDL